MIDPNVELKPGQRVSLPHELVNEIYALLGELPAKTSMQYILAIQNDAEVVEED
jgi:hypothetical protein